jgi:hypothetical protein
MQAIRESQGERGIDGNNQSVQGGYEAREGAGRRAHRHLLLQPWLN